MVNIYKEKQIDQLISNHEIVTKYFDYFIKETQAYESNRITIKEFSNTHSANEETNSKFNDYFLTNEEAIYILRHLKGKTSLTTFQI